MRPRRARGGRRVRAFPRRVVGFVRALFGGGSSPGDSELEGGVGVREPRRPLMPALSGAAALDLPEDDQGDTT